MKEKILVSACLLGTACRYDGASKPNEAVMQLAERYELIPICPECMGGLPTPRIPSERVGEYVVNRVGLDVTAEYRRGRDAVLAIAALEHPRFAVLKARSPACGHGRIYDGSFTGRLIEGDGVCAEALLVAGITVYTEEELAHLPGADEK